MSQPQLWQWRSLPLGQRSGSQIFAALQLDTAETAALLESPSRLPSGYSAPPTLSRYSLCAGPPRQIQGRSQVWTPPVGTIFPTLKALLHGRAQKKSLDQQPDPPNIKLTIPDEIQHLPFTGGWFGWLGYDAAWEIERLPYTRADALPFPVAFWYEPAWFVILDHRDQVLWLAAGDRPQLDQLQQQLDQAAPSPQAMNPFQSSPFPLSSSLPLSPQLAATQREYEAAVLQAKRHIHAGDIFQANLSLRFSTSTTVSPWSIYQGLQAINPSPFASYWQTPWGQVMSCSPERLVQLCDRQAQTRPIAGTRSRGATPEEDVQRATDLLENIKENAEHIMLVDLERNDLGRVCTWGSVQVDELLTIERYSHVMHLVSNVTGNLRPDCDPVDLIRAMFPGGTITGCPKVRCMEIIENLEPVRRSLFYGSCGYLDWRGRLDLNILIRTLLAVPTATSTTIYGQVGAGIVADSQPDLEWHEALSKAEAQIAALHRAEAGLLIPSQAV